MRPETFVSPSDSMASRPVFLRRCSINISGLPFTSVTASWPVSVIMLRRWKLVFTPTFVKALAIVAVLIGPFYSLEFLVHWKGIAMDLVGSTSAAVIRAP